MQGYTTIYSRLCVSLASCVCEIQPPPSGGTRKMRKWPLAASNPRSHDLQRPFAHIYSVAACLNCASCPIGHFGVATILFNCKFSQCKLPLILSNAWQLGDWRQLKVRMKQRELLGGVRVQRWLFSRGRQGVHAVGKHSQAPAREAHLSVTVAVQKDQENYTDVNACIDKMLSNPYSSNVDGWLFRKTSPCSLTLQQGKSHC